ncbi:hypothetical protein EST38_g5329 [Candolleomyces aberdarensis]|uniref:Uncharacterized protein n=1 Tax=Candolleomyces aberdarensis TaxID=2316362 RepID=A0A4V1Q416_9AGAR|nr:hypothetical protein EST38_g5329 [Candolleomyces aberdarensis]
MNRPNIAEERAKLRSKCVYMADDDFLQLVQWYKLQDFDRVVTVREAERFEGQQAAAAFLDPLEEPEVLPPRPAVLAAIVRFRSHDGFYLSACGGWTPASPFRGGPKSFAQCRPSAIAEDPRNIPDIEGDFETGMRQMVELCNEQSPGPQAVGLIDWSNMYLHRGFKVGHRIFEKKSAGCQLAVDEEEEEEEEEDDPEFRIDGWPVQNNAAAQAELNRLRDTHITRPIPAYDIAGNRIRPSRYAAELRGAVVRLEFYLIHRVIDERHVFSADVKRIRVLVPPPPFDTPTPKRKRVAKYDDFDDDSEEAYPPTPTKSRRLR